MTIKENIENKLAGAIGLLHMEVINESHMHNVPPDSETHFKVVLVSNDFNDRRSVARHQLVYSILSEELAGPVHALALHTYTEPEWREQTHGAPMSPPCLGGSGK